MVFSEQQNVKEFIMSSLHILYFQCFTINKNYLDNKNKSRTTNFPVLALQFISLHEVTLRKRNFSMPERNRERGMATQGKSIQRTTMQVVVCASNKALGVSFDGNQQILPRSPRAQTPLPALSLPRPGK